jgi:hypothetical protein
MLFATPSTEKTEKTNVRARVAVGMLICLLVFLFVVPYYAFNKDTNFFPIIGGVIGALSSVCIFCDACSETIIWRWENYILDIHLLSLTFVDICGICLFVGSA